MSARKPPPWSREELAVLRHFYPLEGIDCADRLADRSWHAIHQKAHKLSLRCEKPTAAPSGKLEGAELDEAIRLREIEGWSFARIGAKLGICEASACNCVLIALCPRKGYRAAERDEYGRLLPEGVARLRLALKKGLKGCDIQLRLGLSAGRIALERRLYNAELKAAGKALLPPPGGGVAYSGVKLTGARKREAEALFLAGFGTLKVSERTGVSKTSCTRIRNRLRRRLARKGEKLPGCDQDGVRRVQAESARFVTAEQKQLLRAALLNRVPVARASRELVIGASTAYRIRDELASELTLEGKSVPKLLRPSRVRPRTPTSATWPPEGPRQIYAFRALLTELSFDEAKHRWRQERRAEIEAERCRPRSFDEQLARVRRGELKIAPALSRAHLEPAAMRERAA